MGWLDRRSEADEGLDRAADGAVVDLGLRDRQHVVAPKEVAQLRVLLAAVLRELARDHRDFQVPDEAVATDRRDELATAHAAGHRVVCEDDMEEFTLEPVDGVLTIVGEVVVPHAEPFEMSEHQRALRCVVFDDEDMDELKRGGHDRISSVERAKDHLKR